MIKLTDRLQVIADQINQNETMADIGTDHGFLPIYLWERRISPKVIMADISEGSLNKARSLANEMYQGVAFDFRLGNGFQVLDHGEVDAVVLAGIGGALMRDILNNAPEKARSFQKLILQPRTGQGLLRRWLIENDFGIADESLVREGKYICEVITAEPGIKGISKKLDSDIAYEVPPWITGAGPLVLPFVKGKVKIEENILFGSLKSKVPQEEKVQLTKDRICYLESLLGGI